ncbi:MAG: hypothetical protein U0350_13185 [Caldilineaceae bacterium]
MAELLNNLSAANLSLWVAFLFSLLIVSALAGDHGLARLAQHILVGASLGYVAVLTIRHVLQPRLFTPLWQGGFAQPALWAPLALGVILCVAGLERLLDQRSKPFTVAPLWRRILHGLGMAPVALMLGLGSAVAFVGVLQGTLLPQFWRAATTGIIWSAPPDVFLTGGLTLLLTTATLLHLSWHAEQTLLKQQTFVGRILRAWVWLGQRALWLAAGVIFARLVAARLSLLIGRLEFILVSVNETHLWRWAEALWKGLFP